LKAKQSRKVDIKVVILLYCWIWISDTLKILLRNWVHKC
jgi:hypothetical protein